MERTDKGTASKEHVGTKRAGGTRLAHNAPRPQTIVLEDAEPVQTGLRVAGHLRKLGEIMLRLRVAKRIGQSVMTGRGEGRQSNRGKQRLAIEPRSIGTMRGV